MGIRACLDLGAYGIPLVIEQNRLSHLYCLTTNLRVAVGNANQIFKSVMQSCYTKVSADRHATITKKTDKGEGIF